MPHNNTPNSKWEQQYKREYRRITQAIRRQKKLGYFIPDDVRPLKPSALETVTREDVQKLIKITPQKIRKSSIYLDKETGEAFPGLDIVNSHHKAKPSKAKVRTNTNKKPKQTKRKRKAKSDNTTFETPPPSSPPKENNLNTQIISTINSMLSGWNPAPYWRSSFLQRKTENYHKVYAIWQETLDNEGEYEVAYRLESNAGELIRLLERLLYSSDSTVEDDFNLSRFIELLIGRSLTAIESDAYNEIAREAAMETIRGGNYLA